MKAIRLSLPIKLALLVAFVFLIVTLVSSRMELDELETERKKLELQIDNVNEEIASTQNRLNSPFDDSYITKLAKEKFNYCRPDEIIFYNNLIK